LTKRSLGYEKKNNLYNRTDAYNENGNQVGQRDGTNFIKDTIFLIQKEAKLVIINTVTYIKNGNIQRADIRNNYRR
jgi:hypothetical protein